MYSSYSPDENPDDIEYADDDESLEVESDSGGDVTPRGPVAYRGAANDPAFGYLIALALSIGLTALPNSADLRYTLAWSVLALFGVLAWLLGNGERIGQEKPENLAWGIIFGLIIGTPLYAFGGGILTTTVRLLFTDMQAGELLAYLVFVMPLAETLFFRGILQQNRSFAIVGILSSLWSIVLFFPVLGVVEYPGVAVVIGIALVLMNLTYSYVRRRNGLAAAWLCQIVVNLVLLFLPYLSG